MMWAMSPASPVSSTSRVADPSNFCVRLKMSNAGEALQCLLSNPMMLVQAAQSGTSQRHTVLRVLPARGKLN